MKERLTNSNLITKINEIDNLITHNKWVGTKQIGAQEVKLRMKFL